MRENKSVSYEEGLIERLRDPEYAAEYLNAHLEDDKELFLMALRDVSKAYRVQFLSERSALGRESLYKTLSKSGNPKLSTLNSLLDVMGLRLAVAVKHKKV